MPKQPAPAFLKTRRLSYHPEGELYRERRANYGRGERLDRHGERLQSLSEKRRTRAGSCAGRRFLSHPSPGIRGLCGPQRQRQKHPAEPDGLSGLPHLRPLPAGRHGSFVPERPGPMRPAPGKDRLRLSGISAAAKAECMGKRGLSPAFEGCGGVPPPGSRLGDPAEGRHGRPGPASSQPAQRRPAAAGRHRPGAVRLAPASFMRRTDRRAGSGYPG